MGHGIGGYLPIFKCYFRAEKGLLAGPAGKVPAEQKDLDNTLKNCH